MLDRFALSFLAGSVTYGLRLGLVAIVVVIGGSLELIVWARTIANAAGTLVQGGLSLYAFVPLVASELRAPVRVLQGRFREIGKFLVNTNLAGSLSLAASKLDKILLGILAPPSTVAVYKVATQFATAPQIASDALDTAVYPAFSRSYATGRDKEIKYIARQGTLIVAAVMLPVVIGLILNAHLVMTVVAGSAFAAAATPFTICLLGVAPYVIFFWLRPLLLTTGHAGALVWIVTAGTVVQFAGLLLLVPTMGARGAALGFAFRYIVIVLLELGIVGKLKLLTHAAPRPALSGMKV